MQIKSKTASQNNRKLSTFDRWNATCHDHISSHGNTQKHKMFLHKFVVPLAFWLGILSVNSRTVSKDADPSSVACVNCTICPYPCHNMPSPGSQQGYPVYGAPPPPPPPPPMIGYGELPPPPPAIVQRPCPPGQVVACCQLPPPAPYGYGYGYGPPGGPYVPYEGCGRPTVDMPWLRLSLSIFLIGVYLW